MAILVNRATPRRNRKSMLALAVTAALGALGLSRLASAATIYTWTDGAADNAWNTTSNDWTTGAGNIPWVSDLFNSQAQFNVAPPGTGTITLVGGGISANALTFSTSTATGYTFTGGTLSLGSGGINASAVTSGAETFNNAITLASGAQSWSVGSGGTVTIAGAITRSAGTTVDFSSAGTFNGAGLVNVTSATTANGWATVGGANWAINDGTKIIALTNYATATAATTTAAGTTVANYTNKDIDVTSSPGVLAGAVTINSVRFNTAAADVFTLTGVNTINSGGILVTSTVANNLSTITGGTLRAGAGKEIDIIQNNTSNNLTIGSIISDSASGASTLTKSGNGKLILTSTETFTGGLIVNAGTLSLNTGNFNALGNPSAPITINAGGVLSADNSANNAHNIGSLTLNGGTLTSINGPGGAANDGGFGNWILRGVTVGGNSQSTISSSSIAVSSGVFNVGVTGAPIDLLVTSAAFSGPLTKNGLGTMSVSTLTSGAVTVNAGTLAWTDSAFTSFPCSSLSIIGGTFSLNGTTQNAHNFVSKTLTLQGGTLTSINGVAGPANDGGFGNFVLNASTVVVSGSAQSTISTTTFQTTGTNSFNVGVTGAPIDLLVSSQITGGSTITKTGLGTMAFTGVNTYTGATAVNLGTLQLGSGGSLAGTAVTVASGTTPTGTAGNATLLVKGNYTIGSTTAGSLNIKGGNTGGTPLGQGTLSLVDGTVNTLTLANNTSAATTFTFGSNTNGNNAILNMEVGSTSDQISLAALAKASIGTSTNANVVNITGLGGLNGLNQVLINAPGGLAAGSFSSFVLGTTTGNFNGYTLGLTFNGTQLILTESGTPATAYWAGGQGSVWSTYNAGATNWVNGPTGTELGITPGATTNVFFTANSASNLTTTLGQNMTINSLTFTGAGTSATSPITIAGPNTLTLGSGGLTVSTGSGNHNISAPVALGAAQTWTVTDAANNLTVGGNITGSGAGLTKAGSGTLTFAGTNTYTGGTTISAGTLQIGAGGASGAIAAGTAITDNATLLFNRTDNYGGNFSSAVSGTGAVVLSAGALTFTASNTYSGSTTINGGSLTLTVAGGQLSTAYIVNNGGTLRGTTSGRLTGNPSTGVAIATLTVNNGGTVFINNDAANVRMDFTSIDMTGGTITGGAQPITNTFSGLVAPIINIHANATPSSINTVLLYNNATAAGGTLTLNVDSTALLNISSIVTNSPQGGSAALVKSGAGTATLSGTNIYSGGTTINASSGLLVANMNNGTNITGIGSGAVSIGAGSTLNLNSVNTVATNTTINNTFTGTGTLKFTFSDTTATNTVLAGVTGFNGTIELANSGVNGDKWSPGALTASGAALVIDSGSQLNVTGADTFGSINVQGTGNNETRGAIRLASSLAGSITLAGDTTIGTEGGSISGNISSGAAGTQTLTSGTTNSNGNATFSGIIGGGTGTIALVQAGSGVLTLTGTNTYSGGTTVSAGTLTLSGTRAGGVGVVRGTLTVNTGATLNLSTADALGYTAGSQVTTLNISGTVNTTTNTNEGFLTNLNLTGGTLSSTGGGNFFFTTGAGIASLASASTSTISSPISISTGPLVVNVADGAAATDLSISGIISGGAVAVNKTGTGLLALSGSNTYTGGTTIGGGTLNAGIAQNGATSGPLGASGTISFTGGTLQYSSVNNTDYSSRFSNAASQAYSVDTNGRAVTWATNLTSSGGSLAKTGTGTLTITGSDSYTGGTTVSSGKLLLSGTGSINGSSGITVNGASASLVQTSSTASTPAITLTQGSIDGTSTIGNVTVADLAANTVNAGNGGTGILTTGNLTFNGAATINLFNGSTLTVSSLTLGAVNTTGTVTLNAGNSSWNAGNNKLIGYTTFSGTNFSDLVLGTVTGLTPRQTNPTLVNNAGEIDLVISGDTPKWTGLDSSNWQVGTTGANANWKLVTAGTPTDYIQGDSVLFDDSATGTLTVSIAAANVSPTSVTFNNSTKNYIINGPFGIAAGKLSLTGSGTVTLAESNSYTGGTTIGNGRLILTGSLASSGAVTLGGGANGSGTFSGILQLGSGGTAINQTLASLTTAGTGSANAVVGGASVVSTLTLAPGAAITYAGLLGGAGTNQNNLALVKTGAGTLTLSSNNTYTGGTTISTGTLVAGNANALGSSTLTLNGGTFKTSITGTISNNILVNNVAGNTLDLTASNPLTLSGNLSGSGNLALAGSASANATHLSGNNTAYSGTITVTGYSPYFDSPNATSAAAAWVANSSFFALNGGLGTYSFGALSGSAAFYNQAGTGTSTVEVGALNTNTTFSGTFGQGTGGDITALSKVGNGTFTLSSGSTYTGGTTLSAGVLVAGNATALGTGTLTLNGGTFRGGGNLIFSNPVLANTSTTSFIDMTNTGYTSFFGNIAGSGNITQINSNSNRDYLAGSNSGFTGTFTVNGASAILEFQSANAGSANATWSFGGGAGSFIVFGLPGNGTVQFGALTGNASFYNDNANTATMAVGGLNTNTTYSGVIQTGGSNPIALTKVGTGTLTLSAANLYTAGTTITGGRLVVTNTTGSATGTGTVTVASGGTLAGSTATLQGFISGVVKVQAGGTLAAGNVISGSKLTLSGGLNFAASSTALFALGSPNGTSNPMDNITGGTFTASSTTINVTGSPVAGVYDLFGFSGTMPSLASFTLGSGMGSFDHSLQYNTNQIDLILNVHGSSSWNGAGSDHNWYNSTNWAGNIVPGVTDGTTVNTETATFNAAPIVTGNGTTNAVVVDANRNVQNIVFDTSADSYTIGTNGGSALLLTNGGSITLASTFSGTAKTETVAAPLVLEGANGTYAFTNNSTSASNVLIISGGITGGAVGNTTLTLNGSNTGANTISGVIGNGAASIGIYKDGAGTWILPSANTYNSGTTINAGTLQITNTGALSTGGVIFGTSGTGTLALAATGGSQTYSNTIDASNGGAITISGALAATVGDLTIGGNDDQTNTTLSISSPSASPYSLTTGVLNLYAYSTVNIANSTGGSGQLIVNNGLSGALAGNLNGLNLIKTGSGTLTIAADAASNSLFDGELLYINQGVVQANSTNALGYAGNALAVILSTGGTLSLGGSGSTINVAALADGSGSGSVLLNGKTLQLGNSFIGGNTFTGVIADGSTAGGGLTVDGTGGFSQVLAGQSTYTGPTTISNNGILRIAIANALPTTTDLSVNGSGSTFDLEGNIQTVHTLNGSGNVNNSGGATTFTVSNGGTFSGAIAGSNLALNVSGGTLILNGSSNSVAAVSVGGTLLVGDASNPSASLTSTGVTVNSGGILGGHGTITGPVTVSTGGQVQPGGSIGTLTIAGAYTQGSNTFLGYILDDPTSGDYSMIDVTGGLLTIGTGVEVDVSGTLDVGTYHLFTYGTDGLSGTTTGWTAVGIPGGDTYSFSTLTNHEVDLIISPIAEVPEPTSLGLLGLGALGLLGRRRGKRHPAL